MRALRPHDLPAKRLLIVDDSRLILRMIRDFFTPQGWEVTEAEDGMGGSPAESEVLARARGGTTLQQVLDESALPDGELAEAVCALLGRGTVRTQP
jgi:CheY-like chemotaxis protein